MLPAGHQDKVEFHQKLLTQSSAPEDGRNYRLKHAELIEIIIKIIIAAPSWLFILLQINKFTYVTSCLALDTTAVHVDLYAVAASNSVTIKNVISFP